MKKFVIATMIAACVALCAAVWPHGNAIEETSVPAAETAVSAKEAAVAKIDGREFCVIGRDGKRGYEARSASRRAT